MVASGRKERRIGLDRRQFTYDLHIPERRRAKDRRSAARSDNVVYLPDFSNELVARLISDSCIFHEEDETITITLDEGIE